MEIISDVYYKLVTSKTGNTRKRKFVQVRCPTCKDTREFSWDNRNKVASCKSCGIKTTADKQRGTERRTGEKLVHITGKVTDNRLYNIWSKMKSRVSNPSGKDKEWYTGVTLCDEWLSFNNFANWSITNGYTDTRSIDRLDYNGGYSPGNCRWATVIEQANNKGTPKNNTSGIRCVYYCKRSHKFYAMKTVNYTKHQFWGYDTKEEAFEVLKEFMDKEYPHIKWL